MWGDGNVDDWFGPFESNDIITRNHTWEEKGTYTINARAKDSYGAIGEWSTLTVTMPLNQIQQSAPSLEINQLRLIKNMLMTKSCPSS
jgi:hypothetical protein